MAEGPSILVDGLLVRPGDKAAIEAYWVVVDPRGRILGVRVNQADAELLARQLGAGLVPPVTKSPLRKQDPLSQLIREALDEV